MQIVQVFVLACQLAKLANAVPWKDSKRQQPHELHHDEVRPIPEMLPSGWLGYYMKKFQPYVNTEGPGCWPYPAVDGDGNWSGGLKPTGSESGDCTNSRGQVYVRGAWYMLRHVFIYAYFAPKDEAAFGFGHRYDWESVVIWVDNPLKANAKIIGCAVSGHGKYDKTTNMDKIHFHNGHPLARYYPDEKFRTHRMGWTKKIGGLHDAVEWKLLPEAARQTLKTRYWGDANFPLAESFEAEVRRSCPF